MFKSIRWKLITIYFTLVFIAIMIVGVYITDQLERYNMDNVRQTLSSASNNIANNLSEISDLSSNQLLVQQSLDNTPLPADYELSVILMSTGEIVASTNQNFIGRYGSDVLDKDVILLSLKQSVTELDSTAGGSNSSKIKNIAYSYPPSVENPAGYTIYARAYLDSIYTSINQSKMIFLNATLIALLVTIVLGFLISLSITRPINDLKNKAIKMSSGDFSQRAIVKSNDEIGELASTFNYLTSRLDNTLEEVSSEKSKLDSIINHMSDGLLALDKKGYVVLYNLGLLKLLDISDPKVIDGKHFDQLSTVLQQDITFEEIKTITRGSITNEISKKVTVSTGKTVNVSPGYYSDDIGILKGYVIIYQDVTESVRLEEMRKEFVANVSHELKTPITTIKTYTETLLSGALEDKEMAENFLNVIDQESDRMTSLIRDLLQLSHIDHHKITWEMSEQDINKLIIDCVNRLELYTKEKEQTISFKTDNKLLKIQMDRGKLQQVFMNIISNAIKYTGIGGTILIELKEYPNEITVDITDTGMGIPEQDIPRLFERFYRVAKDRSRDQGGTGLGLSIAKHIIEGHSGTISVKSTVGKGSTFTIKLPLVAPKDVI